MALVNPCTAGLSLSRRPAVAVVFILAHLLPPVVEARSATPARPLDDVEVVDLDVILGASLSIDNKMEGIFQLEEGRSRLLRRNVTESVQSYLEEIGIQSVIDESGSRPEDANLSVSIFGHRFEHDGNHEMFVFMVEVELVRWLDSINGDTHLFGHRLLGVSDDDSLERMIGRNVAAAMEELLRQNRRGLSSEEAEMTCGISEPAK